MDCSICGKAAMPGAMLCAPCKAALKRARYVTVQEDIRKPSVIDVRRQQRRQRALASAPAPQAPAPEPGQSEAAANAQLARRIFGGILVVAALLGGASYFGLHELGARSHEEANSAPAAELPSTVTVTVAPQPAPTPAVAAPAETSRAASSIADEKSSRATPVKPGTIPVKRPMAKNAASFATANGDPPDAVVMPEPEKPAPAPPPPPPPAPDRWQSMRDAIAQCDRENLINGIICGQRARIQYCEGYWGKVPQCPGPTVNPER